MMVLCGLQFCLSRIALVHRPLWVFAHSIHLTSSPQLWKSKSVEWRTDHWSTPIVYFGRALLFVSKNSRILVITTPILCGIVDRHAYNSETNISLFPEDNVSNRLFVALLSVWSEFTTYCVYSPVRWIVRVSFRGGLGGSLPPNLGLPPWKLMCTYSFTWTVRRKRYKREEPQLFTNYISYRFHVF